MTIKYLHGDGKTHTVNIERVKPVHKLRDEYADMNLPIPTCLLREATPIGDVEDDDAVDMYDDNDSIVIEVNNDAESTLTLSDARLRSMCRRKERKAVAVSLFGNETNDRTPKSDVAVCGRRSGRIKEKPGWSQDYA